MKSRRLPADRLAGIASGRGLSAADAAARATRFGPNDIAETPRGAWRATLRDAAGDLMLWFLLLTASVYASVGQFGEAATLFVALVPLVAMDIVLHRRTRASTAGLASRLAGRAVVLRDERQIEVPAEAVVPGDLVVVGSGQFFPADGVVETADALQVDESALTGEAYPVAKHEIAVLPTEGEPLIDHAAWAFAGTRALTGRAVLRVAFTGRETLYGEIARAAGAAGQGRTPLQQAINRLVGVLVIAAVALCVTVAAARVSQGFGWVDALVSAVTLASAALPEEFPVVFAFFLAAGVYRLARGEALVRRAVSVENIGRVTCICSDKTGTLTEGRLRLTALAPAPEVTEERLLALAAVASRADSGDPLDAVILAEAQARGVKAVSPTRGTFPFTEGRKRETVIVQDEQGMAIAVTKGAPEVVLVLAALDETARMAWRTAVAAFASEARKVVACAWRPLGETSADVEPVAGYVFAGLLAFEDPVRAGVSVAVASCREAGIRTMMVTGDHPLTATAVARAVGLGDGDPRVIVGDDLEVALALDASDALARVDVVARATPAQKLTLVTTLQARGEVVAVTGDGVNDVPALKAADVGIAMGERGTRSAREVAAVVLLNDDFSTIVRAIGEGRQLFRNLRLSFAYLLIIHIPLVLTAALIPLAGFPLLYLPVHIVWLELIIHPTALLVFQDVPSPAPPPAPGRHARFFSGREWAGILLAGAAVTLFVAVGYLRGVGEGSVEHARAVALATLTLAGAATTAALSGLATARARLVTVGVAAVSIALIQTPLLATLLHLVPLHLDDWATAIVAAAIAGAFALLARSARTARREADPHGQPR